MIIYRGLLKSNRSRTPLLRDYFNLNILFTPKYKKNVLFKIENTLLGSNIKLQNFKTFSFYLRIFILREK